MVRGSPGQFLALICGAANWKRNSSHFKRISETSLVEGEADER